MADRTHDHVHRLIRAMSPAEKRYFKLYTSRHMIGGRSNYQLLFDAIAAMETYDEAALVRKFRKEAFTRRFAITKRRLYEALLNSLSAYHSDRSVDARSHRLFHQVEVLYDKALYDDAAKVLRTASRLAEQHERPHALLEAQQWRRRLTERGNYGHIGPTDLDTMRHEALRLQEDLATIDALWDAKSRMLVDLYREGPARDESRSRTFQGYLDIPEFQNTGRIETVQGRYLLHHLHSAVAFASGDLSTCYTHLMANRTLLQQEGERTMDAAYQALAILSNLTYVCMRLGRLDEGSRMLQEFRRIPVDRRLPETEDLELRLFATSISLEIALHIRAGDFAKGLELVPLVERGLGRYGDKLGAVRRAGFLYQVAYCYFGVGQTAQALRWCHRLLNELRANESAELLGFGRILELMLLLEQDDRRTLHYALRNTERGLKGHGGARRSEVLALQCIRQVLRANDLALRHAAFDELRRGLAELDKDPLEQVVFEHVDLGAWAESQRTGRSFADVVKQRLSSSGLAA
ncbi:MAG: hypothetical protein H6595_07010 [Flavobacteriales bacterium]|nr:hypothetical protein [Flavobacteriales bacterium]MCB9167215.1 hypothetical protein [Flavobacteriales bacterium]